MKKRITAETASTILRRSGGQCEIRIGKQRCQMDAEVFHHKRFRSRLGGETADNIVHICVPHHRIIHETPWVGEWTRNYRLIK